MIYNTTHQALKTCFYKKGILLLLLISTITILFPACNDDDDYYLRYGVIHKDGENPPYITLDKGNILYPANNTHWLTNDPDGQRVILGFTIRKKLPNTNPVNYNVNLKEIRRILTKNMLTYSPEISDSLGADPIEINYLWIANGYINFDFTFGLSGAYISHMINLVKHTDLPEGVDFLLELRHNAFSDPIDFYTRSLVSFSVEDLMIDTTDPDKEYNIRIIYNGFSREKEVDIKWTPGTTITGADISPDQLSKYLFED